MDSDHEIKYGQWSWDKIWSVIMGWNMNLIWCLRLGCVIPPFLSIFFHTVFYLLLLSARMSGKFFIFAQAYVLRSPQSPYLFSLWWQEYVRSSRGENANILASGPQITKLRTLYFLKLKKLKKRKCPYFFYLRSRGRDMAILFIEAQEVKYV